MDIEIQEQPAAEIGDLIFIDDMHRGRTLQVIRFSLTVVVDKKEEYHRLALYDVMNHTIVRSFQTEVQMQKFIDSTMHSIKKCSEYTWTLRRK
jgi:hypothetical protein